MNITKRLGPSALRQLAFGMIVFTSALTYPGEASASTVTWKGTSGAWTDTASWSTGILPTINDTANIDNSGVVTIGAGVSATAGTVNAGAAFNAVGTLIISGGYITGTYGIIGNGSASGATASGTLSMTSGSANWVNFYVGNYGSGIANMTGGSLASTKSVIGSEIGSHGTVTISGGTWNSSNYMTVGRYGTGTVNINGGAVKDNTATLGANAGSVGTVNITSGLWNNFASLYVGGLGTGVVTLTGGTVTVGSTSGTLALGALGTFNFGNGGSVGVLTAAYITGSASGATVNFNHNTNYTLASNLSGMLAVSQTGPGQTTLTGSNSYSGSTTVSSGTLVLSSSNAAGTSSLAVSGGVLNLGGYSLTNTLGTVSGGGVIANGTITNNGGNYDLQNGTVSAVLAGSNGASKTSSDKVTLTAANTYTGDTTISAGELDVNGSIASATVNVGSTAKLGGSGEVTGNVTVNGGGIAGTVLKIGGSATLTGNSTLSGINTAGKVIVQSGTTLLTGTTTSTAPLSVEATATLSNEGTVKGDANVSGLLKGSGNIAGSLTLSGTLAPGSTSGTTSIEGNLTMNSTAKLVMEITGASAGAYDQIKVSGTVTLAGALDLSNLSGLTVDDKITLIENSNTTGNTTTGYFSEIITSGSTYAITGSSSTYTVTINGTSYLLDYAADSNGDNAYNDVTLTVVPEPGTWVMVAAGLGVLLLNQKRRHPAA